jgi:hypothetical protein
MRLACGLLLVASLLSACDPPAPDLTLLPRQGAVRVVAPRSIGKDYLLPANVGLGVRRQGITIGDGPNQEQVLFINYGGVTITKATNDGSPSNDDATQNRSWIPNVGAGATVTIPAFDPNPYVTPTDAATDTPQEVRDVIVNKVKEWLAPYNVQIVTARPSSGRYSMIVVGGAKANVVTGTGVADAVGVASLDCGNDNQNNIGYAFTLDVQPATTSQADKQVAQLLVAQVIAHEAGHTFGLEHVNSPMPSAVDVMVAAINNNVIGFLMGAQPLTDGSSDCAGTVSTEDTHARLIANPGPTPSTSTGAAKPTITWLAPKNGTSVPRKFTAAVSVTTSSGLVTLVEMVQGGATLASFTAPPYQATFTVPDTVPDGSPIRFTANAFNSVGGKASVAVDFTVQTASTQGPIPCLVNQDCLADEVCQSSMCVTKATGCMPLCGSGTVCMNGSCVPSGGDMGGTSTTTPVEVGKACIDSAECGTDGICATADGKQYCTRACDPAADDSCPSDFKCVTVGADHICGPKGGGCEAPGPLSAGSSGASALFALFAGVALALRRRARRSAT